MTGVMVLKGCLKECVKKNCRFYHKHQVDCVDHDFDFIFRLIDGCIGLMD